MTVFKKFFCIVLQTTTFPATFKWWSQHNFADYKRNHRVTKLEFDDRKLDKDVSEKATKKYGHISRNLPFLTHQTCRLPRRGLLATLPDLHQELFPSLRAPFPFIYKTSPGLCLYTNLREVPTFRDKTTEIRKTHVVDFCRHFWKYLSDLLIIYKMTFDWSILKRR